MPLDGISGMASVTYTLPAFSVLSVWIKHFAPRLAETVRLHLHAPGSGPRCLEHW